MTGEIRNTQLLYAVQRDIGISQHRRPQELQQSLLGHSVVIEFFA